MGFGLGGSVGCRVKGLGFREHMHAYDKTEIKNPGRVWPLNPKQSFKLSQRPTRSLPLSCGGGPVCRHWPLSSPVGVGFRVLGFRVPFKGIL